MTILLRKDGKSGNGVFEGFLLQHFIIFARVDFDKESVGDKDYPLVRFRSRTQLHTYAKFQLSLGSPKQGLTLGCENNAADSVAGSAHFVDGEFKVRVLEQVIANPSAILPARPLARENVGDLTSQLDGGVMFDWQLRNNVMRSPPTKDQFEEIHRRHNRLRRLAPTKKYISNMNKINRLWL